jgi:hypothetical protein
MREQIDRVPRLIIELHSLTGHLRAPNSSIWSTALSIDEHQMNRLRQVVSEDRPKIRERRHDVTIAFGSMFRQCRNHQHGSQSRTQIGLM